MHFSIISGLLLLLAGMVSAQSTPPATTTTTPPVQTVEYLFLGAKRPGNYSFYGSIISVDATATTYEVMCASGALNLPGFPTTTCNLNDPPWTVTDGPSTMIGVLTTAIANVSAVLDESCAISGGSAAFCNYTLVGDFGGTQTTSSTTAYTTVITGTDYVEYPVSITAGADKLVAPTASSTAATAVSATMTSGSLVSRNVVEGSVVGAVMMLAGVLVLAM